MIPMGILVLSKNQSGLVVQSSILNVRLHLGGPVWFFGSVGVFKDQFQSSCLIWKVKKPHQTRPKNTKYYLGILKKYFGNTRWLLMLWRYLTGVTQNYISFIASKQPLIMTILVFEGLVFEPHNERILQLLFLLCYWQMFAKLHIQINITLDVLNEVTEKLASQLHTFVAKTNLPQRSCNARPRHADNPKQRSTCWKTMDHSGQKALQSILLLIHHKNNENMI